jgi:PAS domain S-box-containing protein
MDTSSDRISSSLNPKPESWDSSFDLVPVPLLLVDRTARIVRANPSECRLLGYTAEDIQGRPVWEFIADEEKQNAQERFRDILNGMEMNTSYRRRFKTKTNDSVICELTVQIIRNNLPEGPFALLVNVDVTWQVAEARRRGETARWLAASFRSMPEPTIIIDTLGQIRYLNLAAERLLGWSEAEASGKVAEELIPRSNVLSSDGVEADYDVRQGIALGWSGSAVLVTRGGVAKRMQVRTEPVVDTNGLVLGIAVCLREH